MVSACTNAVDGAALKNIQVEQLGFLGINNDAQLRITSKWDELPCPTASLLAIAHSRGWIAAAGPDALVLAETKSVRDAFESKHEQDKGRVRPFQPARKIPMLSRISHVAFTSDEKYLAVSFETEDVVAVFLTSDLINGLTQPSFQISTNGESLLALLPNPSREKAELVALVTVGGKLFMLNTHKQRFEDSTNTKSQIFESSVSSVAWSKLGKQLVAGCTGGAIHQMTPDGKLKDTIPLPPGLDSSFYADNIVWLENHLFFIAYVSIGERRQSEFRLVSRGKGDPDKFTFQTAEDVIFPTNLERAPHNIISRLSNFPPNIQDILIICSSVSSEIALLTRATSPLSRHSPDVTNVFAISSPDDDSRRATVPQNEDWEETWVVGASLDLSSRDKVYKPIKDDELEQSQKPLPGYWILNHEGVLMAWWVVYDDSVRQGTICSTMAALSQDLLPSPRELEIPLSSSDASGGGTTDKKGTSPFMAASNTNRITFGAQPILEQSSFRNSSATCMSNPSFGTPGSTLVTTSSMSPLGGINLSSAVKPGQSSSDLPSSVRATFESSRPAFGQTSFLGSRAAFGQNLPLDSGTSDGQGSGLRANNSIWGSCLSAGKTASNEESFSGAPKVSGGFASWASGGSGFTSLAPANSTGGQSIFSQGNTGISFKSDITMSSSFGAATRSNLDGAKGDILSSSKSQCSKQNDSFESTFGVELGATVRSPVKDAMDGEDVPTTRPIVEESTTPKTTPAAPKFSSAFTGLPSNGSLFGSKSTQGCSTFGATKSSRASSPVLFGLQLACDQPAIGISGNDENNDGTSSTSILGSRYAEVQHNHFAEHFIPTSNELSYSTAKDSSSRDYVAPSTKALTPSSEPAFFSGDDIAPKNPKKNITFKPIQGTPQSQEYIDIYCQKPGTLVEHDLLSPNLINPNRESEKEEKPCQASFSTTGTSAEKCETTSLCINSSPAAAYTSDNLNEKGYQEREQDHDGFPETRRHSKSNGVDPVKDLSPPVTAIKTPGLTPQSSFSMVGSTFSDILCQRQQQAGEQLGEPRLGENAPVFSKHSNVTSPRSPSPVRGMHGFLSGTSSIDMFQKSEIRSVSTPKLRSDILKTSKLKTQLGLDTSIIGKPSPALDLMEPHFKAKAKKKVQEAQILMEEEDSHIQEFLASEIEPTVRLDEFIAHANTESGANESIPAQVETVYRDINSMIDTIGLNAWSFIAFVKGHSHKLSGRERGPSDFENPDDWVLCEVEDLDEIVGLNLTVDLEKGRVRNIKSKKQYCTELHRDFHRLCARQEDLRNFVMASMNPDMIAATRALPLSSEQSVQQVDLRREYMAFQKLLAEAEDVLVVLRAKVTAAVTSSGHAGMRGSTPTVDTVLRTIQRMTTMAEKRSGDVDVLETQMRKLHLCNFFTNSMSQRHEGTVLVGASSQSRHFINSVCTPSRHCVHNAVKNMGFVRITLRSMLNGLTPVEKEALVRRRRSKNEVLEKVKMSLKNLGPRAISLDN